MSCATIRNWLPSRRTLPSNTDATASSSAILRMLRFLPLKANAEVRETTRTPFTLASALMISSVKPSEKYSSSLSRLRFTNGNTATDAVTEGRALMAPVRETRYQTARGRPPAGHRRTTSAIRARLKRAVPSGWRGAVRSTPAADTSKIQASTRTTGKPRPRAMITNESVQSGNPSPCMIGSTTCRMANTTMAYATSARKTRRRFNSASSTADMAPPRAQSEAYICTGPRPITAAPLA